MWGPLRSGAHDAYPVGVSVGVIVAVVVFIVVTDLVKTLLGHSAHQSNKINIYRIRFFPQSVLTFLCFPTFCLNLGVFYGHILLFPSQACLS